MPLSIKKLFLNTPRQHDCIGLVSFSIQVKSVNVGWVTEIARVLKDFCINIADSSKVEETITNGKVNPSKVGEYVLTYRFTDETGNYTELDVTIKVVDTNPPKIDGITDGEF